VNKITLSKLCLKLTGKIIFVCLEWSAHGTGAWKPYLSIVSFQRVMEILLFTIVKSPGAVAIAETTKSIGKTGASIGRGRDNSWVLPDPERYMSSLHTEIVFKDDKYFAIDHSTNGTFYNDPSEEIGKDNQVELKDGDRLIIGDYEIEVSLVDEEAIPDAAGGPFISEAAAIEPANHSVPPAIPDPLAADAIPMNNAPFSIGVSQQINNDQPLFQSEEILDPLIALSSSEAVDEVFPMGTQGDSENLLSHSIQFPEMIPDNWFDMPLPGLDEKVEVADVAITEMNLSPQAQHQNRLREEIGVGGRVRSDSSASQQPFISSEEGESAVIETEEKQDNVARKPRPGASRPTVPAEAVAEIKKIRESSKVKESVQSNSKLAKPVISISANEDLIAALGLNIQDMSEQQINEINNVVAEFLQVAVKGLMLILKSRSTLKNEFRMSVTTIQSAENNPLKFSPTLDDAMVNMFVRSGNAYIDPVTAVKEGIESVADHQFAVFAGMRSAFNHLLERFNPEILEAKFNKQKSSSLLATKKARNWELFSSMYEDIIKDRDDSFQYLFGDEFVQAYEQQMQQLKLTRANKKQ